MSKKSIKNEKLKAASANLSFHLWYAVRVIKWHSWEQKTVKDKLKREKITASFDGIENQVRDWFPQAAGFINDSLHVFAAESELYTIESVAPDKHPFLASLDYYDAIIGTSAHHACVLFLQRCIDANFWKDSKHIQDRWQDDLLPKLNLNQLKAKLLWERLRVFETSDFQFNHTYENLPSTDAEDSPENRQRHTLQDIMQILAYESRGPIHRASKAVKIPVPGQGQSKLYSLSELSVLFKEIVGGRYAKPSQYRAKFMLENLTEYMLEFEIDPKPILAKLDSLK
jgi:hypothetical protein